MKDLRKRIASLEKQHGPAKFQGVLDGDLADALSRATKPGIYMRFIDPGDSCHLLIVERIAGRLQVIKTIEP